MESMHFASQIQLAVCKINFVCHDCSETRTEDLSTILNIRNSVGGAVRQKLVTNRITSNIN